MNATATIQEPDLFTPRVIMATADPNMPPASEVAWFVKLLEGAGCWMTAGDILLSIQRPLTEDNKRWLRSLASATSWVLPGQKGYLHMRHGSAEEVNRAASTLESQSKKMADRAAALRHNAHRIFG